MTRGVVTRGRAVIAVALLGLVWLAFRRTPTGGVEFALGEFGQWSEVRTRGDDLLRVRTVLSLWRLSIGVSHPPDTIVLREGSRCRAVSCVADLARAVNAT